MKIYLIGICGTAMAALASMLQDDGETVVGSDPFAYPPMGPLLRSRGISILPGWNGENIRSEQPAQVVVGNVARKDNPEVEVARQLGIPLLSMPQLIAQRYISGRTSIVVTGTHGKTTVTSLTAWLLEHAGKKPGFMVGGIPRNFGKGYKLPEGDYFVIEGDEYDTAFFDKDAKFFHYKPDHATITSLEFDHADIYRDLGHLEDTFFRFARIVPKSGSLSWCSGYPVLAPIAKDSPARTLDWGLNGTETLTADQVVTGTEGISFTLRSDLESKRMTLPMWGRHNVLNALAAASLALQAGLDLDEIAGGFSTFKGVSRRFDTVFDGDVTVVDDFAHHPTAVRETLAAARSRFRGRRVFAAYHFESNTSRRKVFEADYADALGTADCLLLTYPLKKNDSLSSEDMLDPGAIIGASTSSTRFSGAFPTMDEMAVAAASLLKPGDVLVAMSGRDFSPFYDALFPILEEAGLGKSERIVN